MIVYQVKLRKPLHSARHFHYCCMIVYQVKLRIETVTQCASFPLLLHDRIPSQTQETVTQCTRVISITAA